MRRMLFGGFMLLLAAGCSSGDAGESPNEVAAGSSIGADENNRYELEAAGVMSFSHTGGLICKVEEGNLVMDFNIDASDGRYEYRAEAPGFDPAAAEFNGEFTLTDYGTTATGTVKIEFGYGPAPEDFPGVVRAAGTIAGPIRGDSGGAELIGSYACFLQDGEVGY